MEWLQSVRGLAEAVGIEPPLVMVSVTLAVVFRFLRAGFEKFASGYMYLAILAVSVLVAFTTWFGGSGKLPGAQALLFAGLTLLLQRALQGAASIPGLPEWLKALIPADNAMVKKAEPPAP